MNQALLGSPERKAHRNIVAGSPLLASASGNSINSTRKASEAQTGNSNLIEILKKEGAKLGIHPKIFYTANNLTTCLLDGETAIKIFGSSSASRSSNLPEAKNFLEGLFQTFLTVFNLKAKDVAATDSVSHLEALYHKSQNATDIDNLGEPWEHFKKALATGHYQLMPIYNENSKGLLEPAAFTVFEKLNMGETKTSLFKQLAHSSFGAADIKNPNVSFLDKVIISFDSNIDMNALQRFSVEAFMNKQPRDSVLMVPWRADAVEKLSSTVVKGVNHIGFTRVNGQIGIIPRHEIEGREYPALKVTTIFTKYPKNFEERELKALTLLHVLSELSAGPAMRFSGAAAKQQIKALVDDTFKNIDVERVSESGASFNPFKILAGLFNK